MEKQSSRNMLAGSETDNSSILSQSQGAWERSIRSVCQVSNSELNQGRVSLSNFGRGIRLDSPPSRARSTRKLVSSATSASQGKSGRSMSSVAMDVEVVDVDSFEVEGSNPHLVGQHAGPSRSLMSLASAQPDSQREFDSSFTSVSQGKFSRSTSSVAMDVQVVDVDDSRSLVPAEFVASSSSQDAVAAASLLRSLVPAKPPVVSVPSTPAVDPMDCIDVAAGSSLPGSAGSHSSNNGAGLEEDPVSPRRRLLRAFGMGSSVRRMRSDTD